MAQLVEHLPCCGFESHLRQLIFSLKNDCLGSFALCCVVLLWESLGLNIREPSISLFLPIHTGTVTDEEIKVCCHMCANIDIVFVCEKQH